MDLMTSPQSGSDQPAISVAGLVRHFDDLAAVDGLDLEVQAGEIYGFLGPNAAGKTTTVRMLCTLLAPTGGRAVVAGFDVGAEPEKVRLRIGVALQDVALDGKQTGVELLRLQGRLYGLSRRDAEQRVEELSTMIDIGDALGRQIGTYSGGMKRRLDLAAALVHNPDVLFLDEPTTGLDPISRAACVGGGAPAERAAGHDDLPHHAVPRRGRRAGRSRRHPQPRSPGRRGHAHRAQAQGRRRPHRGAASTAIATRRDARLPRSVASTPSTSTATRSRSPRARARPRSVPWRSRSTRAACASARSRCARPRSTTCSSSSRGTASSTTPTPRRPRQHDHRRRNRHPGAQLHPCAAGELLRGHELDRRPRAPQHPARAGVRAARHRDPAVLLLRELGRAHQPHGERGSGLRLQGVHRARVHHLRCHRHLTRRRARHRHPGRLLRPAAAHPGAPPRRSCSG